MQQKISAALQILINVLMVILGIWIVFYAFQTRLPDLIGAQLFMVMYHLLSIFMSIGAVLIILLAIAYAIAISNKENKN